MRTSLLCAAAWLAATTVFAAAPVPASYRAWWSDPAVETRIADGIEQNRKGDVELVVVDAAGKPLANAAVDVRQLKHHFLFGCNGFVLGQLKSDEKNRLYEERFTRLFNFVTVPFYWEGIEPVQGQLRYAEGSEDIWRRPPPDRFLPFAKKYGLTLKGHPLLWHSINPSWIPSDPEALKRLYEKRFAEIAARYGNEIAIWDVTNESQVCPKKYPLYSDDREYVAWAFQLATRLFPPRPTLMINEVGNYNVGVGMDNPYFRQVRNLVDRKVGVEGIGFQFHLFQGRNVAAHLTDAKFAPAKLLDVYESFDVFKLPLYVTEITVASADLEQGPEVQAEITRNLYRLWFSARGMAGITWWNLADGTAYKEESKGKGGLLDEELQPKPVYRALEKLIREDWTTRLAAKTNADGRLRLRGFFGKYQLRAGDARGTMSLVPGGRAQQQIVLK